MEKLITKSFRRLLDKGVHRGFVTYEELGKSLGKRHCSQKNIEEAFLHVFDNKVCLVEKKSDYRVNKKRDSATTDAEKTKEGHLMVNYNFLIKIYSELSADQKLKFNKILTSSGITDISKAV